MNGPFTTAAFAPNLRGKESHMRLLLVEDDLPLAEALMSLLVSSGYAVDCVHDGEAAKALVAAEQFDLMILDLNLPHLDGLSVLRAMRASGNRAAVMILTARGTAEDRVRGLDLGADDYMAKPFDIREFEARRLHEQPWLGKSLAS
jgi:two-component system OmpR family response regulator